MAETLKNNIFNVTEHSKILHLIGTTENIEHKRKPTNNSLINKNKEATESEDQNPYKDYILCSFYMLFIMCFISVCILSFWCFKKLKTTKTVKSEYGDLRNPDSTMYLECR